MYIYIYSQYIPYIYQAFIKKNNPRVAILINLLPKNPKHQRLEMLLQMHARKPAHFHGPDTSQVFNHKKNTTGKTPPLPRTRCLLPKAFRLLDRDDQ